MPAQVTACTPGVTCTGALYDPCNPANNGSDCQSGQCDPAGPDFANVCTQACTVDSQCP